MVARKALKDLVNAEERVAGLEMAADVHTEVRVHMCFFSHRIQSSVPVFFNIKSVCPSYGPQKFRNAATFGRKSVRSKKTRSPYFLKTIVSS